MKRNIVLVRNAKAFDFGGGERFPVFTAQVIADEGLVPIIISRSKGLREFATQKHIRTRTGWWWSHQKWSGPWILLTPVYILWQIVLFFFYLFTFISLRPLAVHLQSKDDFIAGTLAARTLGIRVVWTDHADLKHIWQNLGVWYKNPIGKLIYACAHQASAITVVSKSELSLVSANLSSKSSITKKLLVVYNGAFDTGLPEKKSDNESFTFISASRLVSDKGIGELITAFLSVNRTSPKTQLDILGEGQERQRFEALAGGNNAVRFLGHQSDPIETLKKADVFVHPTYHEGFSLAVVEASMLGLPIIATNVGGNLEIIEDQKTGLLVAAQDAESLEAAMTTLLNNKGLRIALGDNARKQYEESFKFDDIVKRYYIPLYQGKAVS